MQLIECIYACAVPAPCGRWDAGLTPSSGRDGEALGPGFLLTTGKGHGCSGCSVSTESTKKKAVKYD